MTDYLNNLLTVTGIFAFFVVNCLIVAGFFFLAVTAIEAFEDSRLLRGFSCVALLFLLIVLVSAAILTWA